MREVQIFEHKSYLVKRYKNGSILLKPTKELTETERIEQIIDLCLLEEQKKSRLAKNR